MNRNDLRSIDLNLLVIFEALMRERNITRAAVRLSLGQPAVSAALKRLRTLFNDPLFERIGRKMEPTARALRAAQMLGPALDSVCIAVNAVNSFDPQTSRAEFRIGVTVDIDVAPLSKLAKRLKAAAPGVELIMRYADATQLSELLMSGEITLGVGHVRELPPVLQKSPIEKSALGLIWWRGHEFDAAVVWLRSELLRIFDAEKSLNSES